MPLENTSLVRSDPFLEKRSMTPKDMEKKFRLPTAFVCPECNGPLWETDVGRSLQFRCHVGHSYSPDSLLADNGFALVLQTEQL